MAQEKFMQRCFELAKKGRFSAMPNPMVGAVIVRDGEIIAEGYHENFGGPHAERNALSKISKEKANGSTLYCNLEPCAHTGKTPPCADAVIEAGIKKVIISNIDPFEKVNSRGVEKLKRAGIEVETGLLEKEGYMLNRHFFKAHEQKRPFIVIKAAASLDSKSALSNGESKWISNEDTRKFSRQKRAEFQGILVGVNTVISDDPNLGSTKRDPLRIIIDPSLKTPITSQVLRDNNCLIFVNASTTNKEKIREIEAMGAKVKQLHDFILNNILKHLYEINIISILVEGGSNTISHFLNEKLADQLDYYIAPILLGNSNKNALNLNEAANLKSAVKLANTRITNFGDNVLMSGDIIFS